MKVLLVNPPMPRGYYNKEFYLPLSLLYLGAVLKRNGDEPKILDFKIFTDKHVDSNAEFFDDKLMEAVNDFKPELIGFGSLFSGEFPNALNFSRLVKSKYSGIPIVFGGAHATIFAGEILKNCPSIDFVVIGEGEEAIVQLVNMLKGGQRSFESIDGFAFRNGSEIVVNPKTRYIENIDSLPFPAFDIVDIKDYFIDTSRWHNPKNLPINTSIPIISSRSCPNRCTFCSMYRIMGPKWRARSPKNVVDELEFLYREYNHKHFSFMDDNFTLNRNRAIEICDLILERKLDIQFETPNGLSINTLNEEVLDKLVAAGMVRTYLAIESGCDYIGNKIIRKNLPREKIHVVAKLIKKYMKLNIAAFFIMGMPEDTTETLMDTYKMIKEINVDRVFLMNIVPFPGTEVFEQAKKDNLLIDTDPDKLYLSDDRYLTNYGKFFLKPYKVELKNLQDFRELCETLPCVKKQPT